MLAASRRAAMAGIRMAAKPGKVTPSVSASIHGMSAPIVEYGSAALGVASRAAQSKMALGMVTGGAGVAAATFALEDDEMRPGQTVPLGSLNGKSDAVACFVPGSISDAVEVGSEFIENWKETMGEEMCFINSNMPITDYPSQAFGLEIAKKRNRIVESGVIKFIENNPNGEVEVFAHSAGTKTALAAVRRYMEKPGPKKQVKIYIMGAGTPEGGLEEDYKALVAQGVKVTEIRDRADFVPHLSGTDGVDSVLVDTDISKRRAEALERVFGEEASDVVGSDGDLSVATKAFVQGLASMVEAHYVGNYMQSLVKYVKKDRVLASARGVGDKVRSTFSKDKVSSVRAATVPRLGDKKWEMKL